ncbi:MAG: GNAT family N-acetyltransferase [Pseudomonadales bacterium]|nr:GNAT family N-acetyltransferase [Pseudomonadales bacterium]
MTALRAVGATDLAEINALVVEAITTWPIAAALRERIAPSYCYDAIDLEHMRLFVRGDAFEAMIALEAADAADAPVLPAILLHGIYVRSGAQGRGLGRELVHAALTMTRDEGAAGLLAKAQRNASGFFAALGFEQLAVEDPIRDYPHRWWKTVQRVA